MCGCSNIYISAEVMEIFVKNFVVEVGVLSTQRPKLIVFARTDFHVLKHRFSFNAIEHKYISRKKPKVMSGTTDNVWASELDYDVNVWGNSQDITQKQKPRSSTCESNDQLPITDEKHDAFDQGIGKLDSKDFISVNPSTEENIDGIVKVERKDITDNNTWINAQGAEIGNIAEDLTTNGEAASIPYHNDEIVDEFDDDFGEFEEIPTEKLTFDAPVTKLLFSIFPEGENSLSPEKETDDSKSSLLTEGGIMPMKCYNTIVADDRQYLSDKIPVMNTRQRGCIEKMELHKAVLAIVGEWIYDEKGIYRKNEDESTNTSWKGAGKNGIFRWSTKTEKEPKTEEDKNDSFRISERKLIGQKLLHSSFEQARRIIEERSESEKREMMMLEKARWEREQKLKKEKLKKEEELEKYNVEHVKVSDKKKKGFFGKMFSGKSKIAKDHLSHEKITPGENDSLDKNELSLMEQLEREGYDLSQGGSKKGRIRKARSRKTADHNDDAYDDDDDSEDDDDNYSNGDLFGNTPNGYDVLDPNERAGSGKVHVLGAERDGEGSDGANEEAEADNTLKNAGVEPNTHSSHVREFDAEESADEEGTDPVAGYAEGGESASSSSEDSGEEAFDDYQTSGSPAGEKPNFQASQPSRDDYLIDL